MIYIYIDIDIHIYIYTHNLYIPYGGISSIYIYTRIMVSYMLIDINIIHIIYCVTIFYRMRNAWAPAGSASSRSADR